jgi:hypothetical protein
MKWAFFSIILTLTSCIELVDDLTINTDGSGQWTFTINASESKTKVSALLALDSLNGRRIKRPEELEAELIRSGAQIKKDVTNHIYRITLKFDSIQQLNRLTTQWTGHQIMKGHIRYPLHIEELQEGRYMMITRLQKPVQSTSAPSQISPSKLAVMNKLTIEETKQFSNSIK